MDLYITNQQRQRLTDFVLDKLSKDQHEQFLVFMASYNKTLPKSVFEQMGEETLSAQILTHFALLIQYLEQNEAQIALSHKDKKTLLQVVVKDRPFLSDTLLMSLDGQGINVSSLTSTIITQQMTLAPQSTLNAHHIALINITLNGVHTLPTLQQILGDKLQTLDIIVGNYHAMKGKLQAVASELAGRSLPDSEHSSYEILSFLNWIDDNFIFMGYREYRFLDKEGKKELYSVGGTGLGLLAGQKHDTLSESFHRLPDELKHLLTLPRVLLLSKSAHLSPIHRPVYMDFLGIQKFDDKGQVIGEYRFLGLLTSRAYQTQVADIPLLREKAQSILAKTGLTKDSHAYTKVAQAINTLPRDDLFQGSIDELTPIVVGIANLQDKNVLKLFVRTDHYNRFVSCLVCIPKHKFDTKLRVTIQETLMDAFAGVSSAFSADFSDIHHTRVHFHIRTTPGQKTKVDTDALEKQLSEFMRDFGDEYLALARTRFDQDKLDAIEHQLLPAMPISFKQTRDIGQALTDGDRLLRVGDRPLWYVTQEGDRLLLKVYGKDTPATLSQILPMLEDFGVSVLGVQTYPFKDINRWLQVYQLSPNVTVGDSQALEQMQQTLDSLWQGVLESDKLNALVLTTTLDGFDVLVLRALSRYMIQATAPFSADYIHQTLLANHQIAQSLVTLFHCKFNPESADSTQEAAILAQIDEQLTQVVSLDEDRIIRWLLDLLQAMQRTNFYQKDADGNKKDRLSFKFKASDIQYLPKPRPMFEIYVYSPKVEGVHLRGGKVARGGLRWSDRMEDYRTEVLGLVKAQMVKNAVIVPVGSKGGFVVKDTSKKTNKESWQAAGIDCYKTYIRGLLDLTDNLVDGQVVPPLHTIRRDGDDPYLVVAADKGTATFSDIANGLSKEYNFWLQDAFASGGSVGYDHKGMGITARGAWESVKRHFRLLGKDIQTETVSVIGIGDMSGDVFGNGMLLSKTICLKAAFNHLHIFIDPNPVPQTSYDERQRLFDERLGWGDYDSALISKGGGVFGRGDKFIPISDEMKQAFNLDEERLTPNELLHKLLQAPVELIWNGGIGTYVKASDEEHAEVGDRANDAIRVNGNQIQAKVIGEGGNLGCTQKGRIEYALNGGRLYTDAIDNSGGVNCSDHEVNIKILLGNALKRGQISLEERNTLLASMTDEVAALVLKQNYLQPQAIELSRHQSPNRLGDFRRFMGLLEQKGRLDRAIEFLPSDETLKKRSTSGQGLTNPELSVLLAYGKMWVYDEMLASDLPDDAYFLAELKKYFPNTLASDYFDDMVSHKLHREIICTYLTNGIINRFGVENVFELFEQGYPISDITRAYAIARDVFGLQVLWDAIGQLDNHVAAQTQIELELNLRRLLKSSMHWFLTNHEVQHIQDLTEHYAKTVSSLLSDEAVSSQFDGNVKQQKEAFVQEGVDETLAKTFARLPYVVDTLDIARLAQKLQVNQHTASNGYFGVYSALGLDQMFAAIDQLPKSTYWDRRAQVALAQELRHTLLELTSDALKNGGAEIWQKNHQSAIAHLNEQTEALKVSSLASLSVLLSQINQLKS